MPGRIFNGDETSFYICLKSRKLLHPDDTKTSTKYYLANKEAVAVLVFISASGKTLPSCIVFSYVRLPKNLWTICPLDGCKESQRVGGWNQEIFFDNTVKGFNKWLEDQNIQTPVLVFVDGHKSHLKTHLGEYCNGNGVIIHALPANGTHLIQPVDVSVI